jgi:hypothetical protein
MTVNELITRLAALDPELRVVMPAEDSDLFCEVVEAFEGLARFVGGEVMLADERERDRMRVVRLFGRDPFDPS